MAASTGGHVQVIVITARTEVLQSLTNGTVGQAAYPKAVERFFTIKVTVYKPEDKFSLSFITTNDKRDYQ
jgi:hypothetical protein